MSESTVLVAGGGVGGLAAALALERAGIRTTVLERAPERRDQGAGLSIWVSGMLALRRLGVADAVAAAGAVIECQATSAAQGRVLAILPIAELARAHGLPPPVSIRRSELLTVLQDAVGPGVVRRATCEGFSEDERSVTVRLVGGGSAQGDVLVAADGIHSAIRGQLHPEVRPRYLGYQSLRAVVSGHESVGTDRLVMRCGRGDRFGYTSVGGGAVWWFGVIVAPEGMDDGPEGRKPELLRRFGRFGAPVPDLIEAARPEDILRHDVRDLPLLERWGVGRVTMLGDAAHAASVAGARGVSLAVEDAVVLAERLAGVAPDAGPEDVSDALRSYEQVRRPAAARSQAWSAEMGRRLSWRNPVACALRDMRTRWDAPRTAAAVDAELRTLAQKAGGRV